MKLSTLKVTSLEGHGPPEGATGGHSHPAVWWLRSAIEVMAVSVGVATLPVSAPVLVAIKLLEGPGRAVADTVSNGAAPLVGAPIARTVDRVLGSAA
jgi:hypothetical protein